MEAADRPIDELDAGRDGFRAAAGTTTGPARRPGVVERHDLVKRFLDGAERPLVVVAAPAGYGKSIAVDLWSDADDRPFAWARLQTTDDDPVHLLRHIAASLDLVMPIGEELQRMISGPGRPFDTEQLPAVGEHLSRCGPVVLVLDDVQFVSSETAEQVMEGLVPYLDSGAQMVFVGRRGPAIPLARRRLDGELLEVGIDELTMDEREAALLLSRAGLDPDDATVARLVEDAEGWAGGLGLTALAYRRRQDHPPAAVGRDPVVVDYLMDEVLAGVDPEMRDFLLRSAVLEHMSAPLLDELLETDRSSRLLSEMVGAGNLFLVPLDLDGEWFRYHHLFRDALLVRLSADRPGLVRPLRERASRLLEAKGQIDAAVRQAVEAGALDRAADLVLYHTIGLIDEGRIALLGQWLDLLGPEMATSHPSAVVAAAWHAVGTTDPTRISRAFSAGDRLSHQGPLADGSPSLEVAMAAVRAIVAAEGTAGVLRDTEIVRAAGGPRTNPWWGFATALQGSVASFSGDNELARRLLVAGIAECGGSVSFEAGFLGVLALVEVDDGDLAGAERHVERAMALCEDHNLEGVVLDIPAYAAAALVAARRGRAEEARTASLRTRRLLVRLGDLSPRSALRGYVALAQAELALGAHVAAREMVAEADRARRMEGECAHLNDQLDRLADALDAAATPLGLAVTPITAAELRVLTYLPTHLTLQEIADATHLSRNTVKSHAVAIYRKLDASSRAEAVAAAREGGLLEAMGATERDHVTRIG